MTADDESSWLSAVFDSAGRPAIWYRHGWEGGFGVRSGNSPQREKANSYSSLEGMVSNAQDKQRMEMVSKSVPGLMSFTNNLRTDK